eukprot:14369051-Ditylum_brightwellii.AAC.1
MRRVCCLTAGYDVRSERQLGGELSAISPFFLPKCWHSKWECNDDYAGQAYSGVYLPADADMN